MRKYLEVWVTLTSAKLPAWTGLTTHSAEYITWLQLQIWKKKMHAWWSFRQNYILPAFLILLSLISHRLVQWIVSTLLYFLPQASSPPTETTKPSIFIFFHIHIHKDRCSLLKSLPYLNMKSNNNCWGGGGGGGRSLYAVIFVLDSPERKRDPSIHF